MIGEKFTKYTSLNLESLFTFSQEALGDDYNLERIIDDFVLLTFLVGNDFIPHLPDFHIHAGSLPTLWQTYKEVRPNLDGKGFLSVLVSFCVRRLGTLELQFG